MEGRSRESSVQHLIVMCHIQSGIWYGRGGSFQNSENSQYVGVILERYQAAVNLPIEVVSDDSV